MRAERDLHCRNTVLDKHMFWLSPVCNVSTWVAFKLCGKYGNYKGATFGPQHCTRMGPVLTGVHMYSVRCCHNKQVFITIALCYDQVELTGSYDSIVCLACCITCSSLMILTVLKQFYSYNELQSDEMISLAGCLLSLHSWNQAKAQVRRIFYLCRFPFFLFVELSQHANFLLIGMHKVTENKGFL